MVRRFDPGSRITDSVLGEGTSATVTTGSGGCGFVAGDFEAGGFRPQAARSKRLNRIVATGRMAGDGLLNDSSSARGSGWRQAQVRSSSPQASHLVNLNAVAERVMHKKALPRRGSSG